MNVLITGTMYAGKSAALLKHIDNAEKYGKRIFAIKPAGMRDGAEIVSREPGLHPIKCYVTDDGYFPEVNPHIWDRVGLIVIDELQFIEKNVIMFLLVISRSYNIPIVAAGLSHDFLNRPFDNVQYFLEQSKDIVYRHVVTCTCHVCGLESAQRSVLYINSVLQTDSNDALQIETNNKKYVAMCNECYAYEEAKKEGEQ